MRCGLLISAGGTYAKKFLAWWPLLQRWLHLCGANIALSSDLHREVLISIDLQLGSVMPKGVSFAIFTQFGH